MPAVGPVCRPNYAPGDDPARWTRYTDFLHAMVGELADQYQPDLFWFDCSNSPPNTDTFLDAVLARIRSNNPDSVVLVRNGQFSDYAETPDQHEELADQILDSGQVGVDPCLLSQCFSLLCRALSSASLLSISHLGRPHQPDGDGLAV